MNSLTSWEKVSNRGRIRAGPRRPTSPLLPTWMLHYNPFSAKTDSHKCEMRQDENRTSCLQTSTHTHTFCSLAETIFFFHCSRCWCRKFVQLLLQIVSDSEKERQYCSSNANCVWARLSFSKWAALFKFPSCVCVCMQLCKCIFFLEECTGSSPVKEITHF